MSNLDQDISALEIVTLNRLLHINKTIQHERNKGCPKRQLEMLKQKRKETDQLLSKIKNIPKDDKEAYLKLKELYLTFQI